MVNHSHLQQRPSSQSGLVLLLVLVTLLLGAATIFLSTRTLNAPEVARQDTVTRELQQAKEALLALGVNYGDLFDDGGAGYGHLPCPDFDGSGEPDSPVSCPVFTAGRLPAYWDVEYSASTGARRAVSIYPREAGDAGIFWYAVSPQFSYRGEAKVNPGTPAELSVNGVNDIVAVIIDPGPPLLDQTRPSNDPADYLEGGNEIANGQFFTRDGAALPDSEFNDRIVYIHRNELMPLVEKRVRHYLLSQIIELDVVTNVLPFAATLGTAESDPTDGHCVPGLFSGFLPVGPSSGVNDGCRFPFDLQPWVANNDWHRHVYYHVDANCVLSTGCVESLNTLDITVGGTRYQRQALVLAFFGDEIPALMQDRSGAGATQLVNYLEDAENTNGDVIYNFVSMDDTHNDLAFAVQPRPNQLVNGEPL